MTLCKVIDVNDSGIIDHCQPPPRTPLNNPQALVSAIAGIVFDLLDDLVMQGQSRTDPELLDAGEVAGHLVPPGSGVRVPG